jgi:hypothetical protein
MLLAKMLFNSMISTKGEQYMTMDISMILAYLGQIPKAPSTDLRAKHHPWSYQHHPTIKMD